MFARAQTCTLVWFKHFRITSCKEKNSIQVHQLVLMGQADSLIPKSDQLPHWGLPISPPSATPSAWIKITIMVIRPCCSTAIAALSGSTDSWEIPCRSCHLMWCWMGRPPGVSAWQEEGTLTSPWPSPGWVMRSLPYKVKAELVWAKENLSFFLGPRCKF